MWVGARPIGCNATSIQMDVKNTGIELSGGGFMTQRPHHKWSHEQEPDDWDCHPETNRMDAISEKSSIPTNSEAMQDGRHKPRGLQPNGDGHKDGAQDVAHLDQSECYP